MGTAPKQNIHIHLAGCDQQSIGVARGNDGMTMGEANPQASMVDDLREGEVRGVDIVVTLDHLQVWSYLAEVFIGFAVGEITQT